MSRGTVSLRAARRHGPTLPGLPLGLGCQSSVWWKPTRLNQLKSLGLFLV